MPEFDWQRVPLFCCFDLFPSAHTSIMRLRPQQELILLRRNLRLLRQGL